VHHFDCLNAGVSAAILIACLLTLYLFLGLYYFSLMTIAYEARGSQYMSALLSHAPRAPIMPDATT
jgi:hypothetical protein